MIEMYVCTDVNAREEQRALHLIAIQVTWKYFELSVATGTVNRPVRPGPVRSKILDRPVKTAFSRSAGQEYFSFFVSIFWPFSGQKTSRNCFF